MAVIAENRANKRTSWQATPTDIAYPSEKLTKDALDTKADTTALNAVKGTGWTDENLVDHETRIDTLETNDTLLKESLLTTKLAVNELERQNQIGNGATLDFDDIGSVALDARATGRANPTVEGLTATNLLKNSGFSDGFTYWRSANATTPVVTDRVVSFTATAQFGRIYQEVNFIAGEKWFIIARVKASSANVKLTFQGNTALAHSGSGAFEVLYGIPNMSAQGTGVKQVQIHDYSTSGWAEVQIDGNYGVSAFNLTQTFGAGNEPSEADCAKIFSYFDGTKSIQMPARVRSVGKNLFDISTVSELRYFTGAGIEVTPTVTWHKTETGIKIDSSSSVTNYLARPENFIDVLPSTQYTVKEVVSLVNYKNIAIWEYDSNYNLILFTDASASGGDGAKSLTITTTAYTRYIKIGVGLFTSAYLMEASNIMLELGSTATSYEPYTDSTLYIADDSELRSVPAITDEVKVVNGELVKVGNVEKIPLNSFSQDWKFDGIRDNDTVANFYFSNNNVHDWIIGTRLSIAVNRIFSSADNGGTPAELVEKDRVFISSYNNLNIFVTFTTLGTTYEIFNALTTSEKVALFIAWLDTQGLEMFFKVNNPITTPLTTSGALKAFQNGSVYYEPYYEGSHQTNASSQITLPYEGTIDAVYGYDDDFVEYLLDDSDYSLTGTTLTITGALENEVFYVQMQRSEPLAPEMGVNVINNAEVAEDSVTGKFYKKTFTVANGVPTFGIEEVV